MAVGDLTATHIVTTSAIAQSTIKAAIDAETLAAATDTIHFFPIEGREKQISVWKVERAAA